MIDDDYDPEEEEEEESDKQEEGKNIKRDQLYPKHRKYMTRDNKINQLVRIGKDRYLCFDWDKCRYFTWDKKRKSIALFKKRALEGSDCVTGCNLFRKFLKVPLT
jgi:hypothetical protein